jgi:hypothetical protein
MEMAAEFPPHNSFEFNKRSTLKLRREWEGKD